MDRLTLKNALEGGLRLCRDRKRNWASASRTLAPRLLGATFLV